MLQHSLEKIDVDGVELGSPAISRAEGVHERPPYYSGLASGKASATAPEGGGSAAPT